MKYSKFSLAQFRNHADPSHYRKTRNFVYTLKLLVTVVMDRTGDGPRGSIAMTGEREESREGWSETLVTKIHRSHLGAPRTYLDT